MERDIELSDLNFSKLQGIIHKNTGITIAEGRKSMLLSRLRSRLREVNEPDFKSYLSLVSSDSSEMQELINRVTTNKTYFYRTPRIWEHFRKTAVQEFLDKAPKRPMRVWSAASSTGEEAHTVGVILEDVRKTEKMFDYTILGTDVSSRVIKSAEKGHYSDYAVNALRKDQPELFNTYIDGNETDGYTVDKTVRARIKFKLHNLQKRLSGSSPFDVVFLRNVLIYFTAEDQEHILRNVLALMPPDGTLYIGESETLTRLNTDFDILEPMIYRPKDKAARSNA